MNSTIWSFPIPVREITASSITIEMPLGAQVLAVQIHENYEQKLDLCIWAMVDPSRPRENRTFRIVGTGHNCDGLGRHDYVGTAQVLRGRLVFHVFELSGAATPGPRQIENPDV